MKTKLYLVLILVTALIVLPGLAYAMPQDITVKVNQIFAKAGDNTIIMKEGYSVDSAKDGNFAFTLPAGAANVEVMFNGAPVSPDVQQGIYTIPLPVGTDHEVIVNYNLSAAAKTFDFSREVRYLTGEFYFVVEKGVLTVQAPALKVEETVMGPKTYLFYSGTNLTAGTPLDLTLVVGGTPPVTTPTPAPSGQIGSTGQLKGFSPQFHNDSHIRFWVRSPLRSFEPHIVSAVAVLLPIFGTGYYIYRRRKDNATPVPDKEEVVFQRLVTKQKALLTQVAELDTKHENGEITPDEYQSQREVLMEKLVLVKKQIKNLTE